MARFPKIQSPCPYQANLSDYLQNDVCSMCKRQVHDLSAMTEQDRDLFLSNCGEEVCVSYKVPARAMLGAAIIATSLQAGPVAASELLQPVKSSPWLSDNAAERIEDCFSMDVIIVGGIKKMSEVEYIDTPQDLSIPEIPVIYEDGADRGVES